jgi:N-acetylglutamate synthase-like GNAT family acetyltransferase
MSDDPVIAIEPPDEAVNSFIRDRLAAFNRDTVDRPERQRFTVVLREGNGTLRGGLVASVNFDVMLIEDLFVENHLRRGGQGSKLLRLAEEEGVRLLARLACVSTYSWQARPFYEKHGYTMFAELPYASGAHRLYWLSKALQD